MQFEQFNRLYKAFQQTNLGRYYSGKRKARKPLAFSCFYFRAYSYDPQYKGRDEDRSLDSGLDILGDYATADDALDALKKKGLAGIATGVNHSVEWEWTHTEDYGWRWEPVDVQDEGHESYEVDLEETKVEKKFSRKQQKADAHTWLEAVKASGQEGVSLEELRALANPRTDNPREFVKWYCNNAVIVFRNGRYYGANVSAEGKNMAKTKTATKADELRAMREKQAGSAPESVTPETVTINEDSFQTKLRRLREDNAARLREEEAKLAGAHVRDAWTALTAHVEQSKDDTLRSLWAEWKQAQKLSGNAGTTTAVATSGVTRTRRSSEEVKADAQKLYDAIKAAGKEGATTAELKALAPWTGTVAEFIKSQLDKKVHSNGARGQQARYMVG